MLIGVSPWWMVRSSGLDVSTLSILARMSEAPDQHHISVYDNVIRGLKQNDIWDGIDHLLWMAAHSDQASRIDWRRPDAPLFTLIGSPQFGIDSGWQSLNMTGKINTGFVVGQPNDAYKLNNASVWAWVSDFPALPTTSNNYSDVGANTSGTGPFLLLSAGQQNINTACVINHSTINILKTGHTIKRGLYGGSVLSGDGRMYQGGVEIASILYSPSGIPTSIVTLLGRPTGDAANINRRLAFFAVGSSLRGKESAFYSIIKAGMNALGVYE